MDQPGVIKDASGKEHKASIFAPYASAALAKAVVFAAEARVASQSNQFIWSSVACYYSLFHLTVSLLFTVPMSIPQKKLSKLISRFQSNTDPTYLIQHKELDGFLRNYESEGMPDQLRIQLRRARELREFVNYEPRIVWGTNKTIFRTRMHELSEIADVLNAIEALMGQTLLWASQQSESSRFTAIAASIYLKPFLTQEDLMYAKWCSSQVLKEAEQIRIGLPFRADW